MKKLTMTNKTLYGIAALFLFWLGDWMGSTYQMTEGTTTQKITAAVDVASFMAHPFRLSFLPFSLLCGLGAVALAALIAACVVFSKHRLIPQKEYGSARGGNETDSAPFCGCRPAQQPALDRHRKAQPRPAHEGDAGR